MKLKQVLIEKYIKPSETGNKSNDVFIQRWFDKNYDLHSFMSQPAYISYYKGKIIYKIWYKKGICHRDGDLPAFISYNNGQIYHQKWYKNGKLIKSIKQSRKGIF